LNPAKNSLNLMGESINPARKEKKNSHNLTGEFPTKEHCQNCYGDLLDKFPEIDAIIGDILFHGFADHILHPVREKMPFWGHR
jgi:hypothetical protein